jgi:hypothetical protein
LPLTFNLLVPVEEGKAVRIKFVYIIKKSEKEGSGNE